MKVYGEDGTATSRAVGEQATAGHKHGVTVSE